MIHYEPHAKWYGSYIYILYASKNKKENTLKVQYNQLKSKYNALKKN